MKMTVDIQEQLRMEYSNPFSHLFNIEEFKESISTQQITEQSEIIELITNLNRAYTEFNLTIAKYFSKYREKEDEFIIYLIGRINSYFLDEQKKITNSKEDGHGFFDVEKITFSTYETEAGYEVYNSSLYEICAEVLNLLISSFRRWDKESNLTGEGESQNAEQNELDQSFAWVWSAANLIFNLEDSVFYTLAYKNGIIEMTETELLVKVGDKQTESLRFAGFLRLSKNITTKHLLTLEVFKNVEAIRIGVAHIEIIDTEFEIIPFSDSDINAIVKPISSLADSHPYFNDERISHYESLTIDDLMKTLILIEEIANKLLSTNLNDQKLLDSKLPVTRIKEKSLIDFLSKATEFPPLTIQKIIEPLINRGSESSVWKSPLYKSDEYIEFFLPAMIAPNYCLLVDHLMDWAGYTNNDKDYLFNQQVGEEVKEIEKNDFLFKKIYPEDLNLSKVNNQTNTILEIRKSIILIEVVTYNFPLSSKEEYKIISEIKKRAIGTLAKKKELEDKISEKEVVPIILTNYPLFSGRNIENVQIIDLALFLNYFNEGKYTKLILGSEKGKFSTTNLASLTYYSDEESFNDNLLGFLKYPPPIRLTTQLLRWSYVQITPEWFFPKVRIESISLHEQNEYFSILNNVLTNSINYKYFEEPSPKDEKICDDTISFSLEVIFHQIAYAPYGILYKRYDTYHTMQKTKTTGFAHLVHFIANSIPILNEKPILELITFEKVNYDSDHIIALLSKYLHGPQRLSEFEFPVELEYLDKVILASFAIDALESLIIGDYDDTEINLIITNLIILKGFLNEFELSQVFYASASIVVEILNINNKFQLARDLSEELLVLFSTRKEPYYGWGILFKCFTFQQNQFESALHGSIFLSSLLPLKELPYFLALDITLDSMKFFRNFRLTNFVKSTYRTLKQERFNEYDKQKIAMTYFNALLQEGFKNEKQFDEAIHYLKENLESILQFGIHSSTPWVAYFYNVKRVLKSKTISFPVEYQKLLEILERDMPENALNYLNTIILGGDDLKNNFVNAILRILETRSYDDYSFEIQRLNVSAENLIEKSLNPIDFDGLFLAGLVENDQTLVYENKFLDPGTVRPTKEKTDSNLERKYRNYSKYILDNLHLQPEQLFVWIFNHLEKVNCLLINDKNEISISQLSNWDLHRMQNWISNLPNFYFNNRRNNYYDLSAQEAEHESLLGILDFASLGITTPFNELLISHSIDLAQFPTNLLLNNGNFVASTGPVANVISIEWLLKYGEKIQINQRWKSSAWIPIDDGDPTVCWGYDKVLPILEDLNTTVYTSRYPNDEILSEINVFLAHGTLDSSGFKAIYTNDEGESAIPYPNKVFGKGIIAILFICNTGSAKGDIFSNRITSFSMELLRNGYKAVIAPFWPLDVAISPIWLASFINHFKEGNSVSKSVFMANSNLGEYNQESSTCYFAPAGKLAMHLFGNPNIHIELEESQ